MKPLFRNYSFDFTSGEKKVLSTMLKQILNQIEADPKLINEVKYYRSTYEKLMSAADPVKLTKEELKRLETQVSTNIESIKVQITKSWFLKRWILKPVLIQYENVYSKHLVDQRK